MNAPVHRRIVEHAALFIDNHGTLEERQALWRLTQLAGGRNELMQILCTEADNADSYTDLQFYVPWPAMTCKSEYHGRWMTGLNHYVNAFLPDSGVNWDGTAGYHYPWSSQTTMDAEFHSSLLDAFGVNVEDNPDKSLVLGRVPPYWTGNHRTWDDNWAAILPFSEYAPCSAVAATYYDHLVNHYYDPMPVNVYGNKPNLLNLQKLGAILHFMGDAIVPQHVRAAHGFYHIEWEATAETLVANNLVNLNDVLVRDFLSGEPFNQGYYWIGGPLNGLYAVDLIIRIIADMTREKVQSATNTDINTLWDAGDPFWLNFLLTQTLIAKMPNMAFAPENCMNYLYNLGITACVYTLRRASEDLLARNIGPAPPEIVHPLGFLPGAFTPRSRQTFEGRTKLLLRFSPSGQTPISGNLRNLEQIFMVDNLEALDTRRVSRGLAMLQESIGQEILQGGRCAQEPDEVLSRFDSGFGLYAFRPPTMEECADERQFRQYLAISSIHQYKIHLLNLTMTLSILNAAAQHPETLNPAARQVAPPADLDQRRGLLERRRQEALTARALPRPQRLALPPNMRFVDPGGRPLPLNIRRANP